MQVQSTSQIGRKSIEINTNPIHKRDSKLLKQNSITPAAANSKKVENQFRISQVQSNRSSLLKVDSRAQNKQQEPLQLGGGSNANIFQIKQSNLFNIVSKNSNAQVQSKQDLVNAYAGKQRMSLKPAQGQANPAGMKKFFKN